MEMDWADYFRRHLLGIGVPVSEPSIPHFLGVATVGERAFRGRIPVRDFIVRLNKEAVHKLFDAWRKAESL